MKQWDPEAALQSLTEEAPLYNETPEQQAKRIFIENLPLAAQSIAHIAAYSVNEPVRFRAAQYIVERNLGRLVDANALSTNDPFSELLAECVSELAPDGPLLAIKSIAQVADHLAPEAPDNTAD
jgi:hypothetical protein